ncbi:AraC family transcriptional regulator [Flavobacterium akiainvivens]|uniref:AraC family transcriptional regulator n=1 Tax=Flavobacterium akiainvivens TaxID=1202724 RepID=A0A0M8MKT7_9FLAO|nr:helix-turn-helix transcriptional regulator [Flavobacterium akiainvivens]KOS08241.1 AraC family transcriptional regulator [Flavobacterium akiainvivens]SFQ78655.1 Helix-turn-helix domain-containing protein [Flavobacterium akiainvivens]
MKKATPYKISSISELHRLFGLKKPDHPLISVIDFESLKFGDNEIWKSFYYDFYCVACKKKSSGKFKYGQRDYDFDEGIMGFTKPGQLFSVTSVSDDTVSGHMLVFKAELIRPYPLGKNINNYGFFAYSIAEALHLSDKEDVIISSLLVQIQNELKSNIDKYSQDVIVSHIDLLLNYSNRFYNRQFLTRKAINNDLLTKLEQILNDYFNAETVSNKGLLTVQYIANEVNLSPSYLSDLLRNTTGQNAQQYIQKYLIEKAKELLTTTNFSVSEIAYQLGFEYSQSFSKLFKAKTKVSPLVYRHSFN